MLAHRKWLLACALVVSACAFHAAPNSASGDGASADPSDPDAPVTGTTPDSPDDIVNLAASDERLGTADVTIGATSNTAPDVTIDTGGLTITGTSLPAGAEFVVVQRDGTGAEIAVLRARNLALQGQIHVVGTRPLVILAESVQTSAAIDVTAHNTTAGGPGGPYNGDHNVLTSNRGGAIEIYARLLIANSNQITAGTSGRMAEPGAIVLQSASINNGGTLSAVPEGRPGDDEAFGPGGGNGHIVLLYKDALTAGSATPMPIQTQYGS